MAKRLRKKEIRKPDELVSTVDAIQGFFQHTWKPIAAAVGIVIVVTAGILLWRLLSTRGEAKAAALLNQGIEAYHAATEPSEDKAADAPRFKSDAEKYTAALQSFDTVLKEHRNSRAAKLAAFYKAGALLRLGRIDEARDLFADVALKNQDDIIGPLADLSRIRLVETRGDWQSAVTEYDRLLNIQSQYLPQDLLLFGRAGALENLSRWADAAVAYRKLVDENPESPFGSDAESALTRLEDQHGAEIKAAEAQPAGTPTPAPAEAAPAAGPTAAAGEPVTATPIQTTGPSPTPSGE